MKIIFYAPDTALPAAFTKDQCILFRAWASDHLRGAMPQAEVLVMAEPMIDSSCQMVAVEGGTPDVAREVYGFSQKLLGRYCALKKCAVPPGRQVWVGGFCKWQVI